MTTRKAVTLGLLTFLGHMLLWTITANWSRYEMNRCAPDLAPGPMNTNANYVTVGFFWPIALPVLSVSSQLPCPGKVK